MQKMLLLFGCLLLIPCLHPAEQALAVSAQAADAYAKAAVAQQRENLRLGCGFSGNRWSTNYRGHYDWARRVSSSQTASENRARLDSLRRCRASKNGSSSNYTANISAAQYAQMAISQQKQNLARGCGYRGDAWHTDYNRHFNWAKRVSQASRRSEIQKRKNLLARCTGSRGGTANTITATQYAQVAISQQKQNLARGCGYRGDAWHTDYNRHFNWAKRVSQASRRSEIQKRNNLLNRCKARKPAQKLFGNWNRSGCAVTDNGNFILRNTARVSLITVWYNWRSGQTRVGFRLFSNGRIIFRGQFIKSNCDPHQHAWCRGEARVNLGLDRGAYQVRLDDMRACQNMGSGGNGFVQVYGASR